MNIEYLGLCENGLVRKVNQDAVLLKINEYAGLFVVADGMGGHSNGEIASKMIIQSMEMWWNQFSEEKYQCDFKQMICSIQSSLEEVNKVIFHTYNQGSVCGSTLLVLLLYKNRYAVIHAGDSRAYLLKSDFRCITVDDVWENQPGLRAEDRNNKAHLNYGHLTNALGIFEKLKVSIQAGQLCQDMLFLLCSDGLYKMCDEKKIEDSMQHILNNDSMQLKARELKDVVYANGARDNISMVMVKLNGMRSNH